MDYKAFIPLCRPISVPVCLVYTDGTIVYSNPSACELLNYEDHSLHGKNILDIAHGQKNKTALYLRRWASSSQPVPGILELTTSDGKLIDCQCRGNLIAAAADTHKGLILLQSRRKIESTTAFNTLNEKILHLENEIKIRRKTERALRKSDQHLQLVIEATSDGIWEWDIKTQNCSISPRFAKLLGYPQVEMHGNITNMIFDHIHPDDRQWAEKGVRNNIYEEKPFNIELRMKKLTSEYGWFLLKGMISRNKRGEPLRMAGSIADISKQKLYQQQLKNKQETLDKAQKIAHIGSWYFNINTGLLQWSDEIYRIFGTEQTSHKPTYENFLSCVHKDDIQSVIDAVNESIENTDKKYDIEHRVVRPDGNIRVVHEQGKVYRDKDNKPQYMIGTVLDITDRVTIENKIKTINLELEDRIKERTRELSAANNHLMDTLEKLRQTQDQLVQSEKMAALGSLVAGIAHEINTPVGNGVTAASHLNTKATHYTTLHEKGHLSRDDIESLLSLASETSSMILNSLKHAADLVSNFKQVAIDQSNDNQRYFFLKNYIQEIIRSLIPGIQIKNHTIKVECPDNIELYSYPGAISRIITSLVMNSLIHGFENKSHGEIQITISHKKDNIFFHFSDNGKGIPENKIKQIYDPFYTTKRGVSGSCGLGLHIVYNLVTSKLGGTIHCRSCENTGTEFNIIIPAEKCKLRTVA